MTREKVKKIAVDAINRIVTAAKDLAEAEAILLAQKNTTEPIGNKHAKKTKTKEDELERELRSAHGDENSKGRAVKNG